MQKELLVFYLSSLRVNHEGQTKTTTRLQGRTTSSTHTNIRTGETSLRLFLDLRLLNDTKTETTRGDRRHRLRGTIHCLDLNVIFITFMVLSIFFLKIDNTEI